MKVVIKRNLHLADVDLNRQLRLDSLVNMFQEAAITHTAEAGIKLNLLLDSGKTWVLNKLAIKLQRTPLLDEDLEIHTWSRSIKRFKGLRDFKIFARGESVCVASTVWLYLDVEKRKPARVPDNYENLYGVESDRVLDFDLEKWKPKSIDKIDHVFAVTTRISDFDINSHVNNAVALQYIQTAINRRLGERTVISGIRLQYTREIPAATENVETRIQVTENGCLFEVADEAQIFISGEADFLPTT